MFRNQMPRYEILSAEAMSTLDGGWRRLVSELGVEFMSQRALDLFSAAGQRVEGDKVFFDPDFILEQVAKAPREFDLQARNPANNLHIGGDMMAFGSVYGPPFVREGAVRRDATMDDFRNFTKLAQSFPIMDSAGGVICEPNDTPLDSRHLDMTYALATLTDKVFMGNVVSGPNAKDTIELTSILLGGAAGREAGRASMEQTPALISLINCNSPLRWDDRMLDSLFEYAEANQAVVLTPFILMGAMSPVTIPAALVQQIAEALTGIALAQLIRPGCPVVFGSFLSNIDMQSGSPTFGTPESGIGLLCTGQIARHFGLPFRSGGTLTSSQVPDAQAGYEALMTLLPTFLAGANWVMHSAGWLEGGLVAGYEKYIVDIELLQMMHAEFTPLEIDEESLAFGAHEEVGSGGHFLGRGTHDGAVPHLLLPSPALVLGELRAMVTQRWQRRCRPGLEDLPGQAHGLRAAAARRGDPRRDGGVRRTPSQGAGGLMELARSSWGDSANAGAARRRLRADPRRPRPARASCTRSPGFLFGRGGNIMESQQFFDRLSGWFFMRIDFTLPGTDTTAESLRADFAGIAAWLRADLRDLGRAGPLPDPGDGQQAAALPQRPAVPRVQRQPADRHPGGRLQPP